MKRNITIFTALLISLTYASAQTIIGTKLTAWPEATGAITIPSGVDSIAANAFEGNTNITSIDLNEVEVVLDFAFNLCSNLATVSMPNVTYIGGSAFRACKFTTVDMPNVITIMGSAFQGNYSLTNVTLPNVLILTARVFENCQKLTSLTGAKVHTINTYALSGCILLNKVVFPKMKYVIGTPFINTHALTTIDFSEANLLNSVGTTSIPDSAKIKVYVYSVDMVAKFPETRNYQVLIGSPSTEILEQQSLKDEVKIYSNSASDILQVQLKENFKDKTIRVVDMTGKLVLKDQLTGFENTFNIGHLSKGVYFVKIGDFGKKIILE